MRTNYLHLLLLFVGPVFITAQNYVPFTLEDGVTWNDYGFLGLGDPPGSGGGSYTGYAYLLDGDTLVNDYTYKKVYTRDEWYYRIRIYNTGPDMADTMLTEENYENPYMLVGGLRQDTAARTVHFVNWWNEDWIQCTNLPESGQEELLYDFSLSVGDTIQTLYGPEILQDIATITLEDASERRLYYFSGAVSSWVEGIGGAELGLFSPWTGAPFESGCSFICYRETGDVLFRGWSSFGIPNTLNATCNGLIINTDDVSGSINVRVSPNPASDAFNLVLMGELNPRGVSISVYNGLGQLMYNDLMKTESQTIQTDNWPSGTYYLSLQTKEGVVYQTLLVKS